jgi:uncharacterized membrane protein
MSELQDFEALAWLSRQGHGLRARMAAVAASVAGTEEAVAATLERLAMTRPREAERLRARAQFARLYAAAERNRADCYSCPPAGGRYEDSEEPGTGALAH